eukprot:2638562-Prymnesium_polylepis.1
MAARARGVWAAPLSHSAQRARDARARRAPECGERRPPRGHPPLHTTRCRKSSLALQDCKASRSECST